MLRKLPWFLLRAVTVALTLAAVLLAVPLVIGLYLVFFGGAQPGDLIFPDTRIIPVGRSLFGLLIVAILLVGAYVADRIAVHKLRALA